MSSSFVTPSPSAIQQLFSKIAPKYDLLNRVLSFGLDKRWRRVSVKTSMRPSDLSLLDVGTGSGKFIKEFCNQHRFSKVLGIDFCEELLDKARREVGTRPEVELRNGDLLEIDLEGERYDIVSASFVLRSIENQLTNFFKKAFLLLNPQGGRLVILELTRPTNPLLRFLFWIYLKCYLPLIGKLLSGSGSAYQFLSNSILHFKEREQISDLLHQVGFSQVTICNLSGGIATLFIAERMEHGA